MEPQRFWARTVLPGSRITHAVPVTCRSAGQEDLVVVRPGGIELLAFSGSHLNQVLHQHLYCDAVAVRALRCPAGLAHFPWVGDRDVLAVLSSGGTLTIVALRPGAEDVPPSLVALGSSVHVGHGGDPTIHTHLTGARPSHMDVDTGFRCCAVATSRNIITIYPLRPDSESIVALSGSKQFSFALPATARTAAVVDQLDDMRFLEPNKVFGVPDAVYLVLLCTLKTRNRQKSRRLFLFRVSFGGSAIEVTPVGDPVNRPIGLPVHQFPAALGHHMLRQSITPLWIPDTFAIAEPGQLRLINAALFEAAPVLTAAALVPTVIGETVSLPAAAPSTSSPPDAPFGARQIVAAMTVEQVGGVAASLLIVTESGRALRASVTPSLKAVLKPAGDLVPPAALAVMSSGTMYIAGDGQDGVVAQLNSASGEYEVVTLIPSTGPLRHICGVERPDGEGDELYLSAGKGTGSNIFRVRDGHDVQVILRDSMEGITGLWTLPALPGANTTAYIVLSFEEATRVLCVGDQGGAEGETELALHDYSIQSSMVIDEPTLEAGVCRDTRLDGTAGVMVQVRRNGIRMSRPGSETNCIAGDWSPEVGATITMAAIDDIYVLATLHCKKGDRIVLLTLDTTGKTVGVTETAVSEHLPAQASCLYLITSLAARGGGPLLGIVGTYDATLVVLELSATRVTVQQTVSISDHVDGAAIAHSVLVSTANLPQGMGGQAVLVGVRNGAVVCFPWMPRRAVGSTLPIDTLRGVTRQCGTFPVTLVRGLHGATIALTNRPMTIHARCGRLVATPMAFPAARLAAPFLNAFLEDTTVLVDEGSLSFVRIAKTGRLSAQAVLAQPFTAGFSFQCSDYDAEHGWLFALAVQSQPACSTILVAIDDREASIFAEVALQPGESGNMVAVIKVPGPGGGTYVCVASSIPGAGGGRVWLYSVQDRKLVVKAPSVDFKGPARCVAQHQDKHLLVGAGDVIHVIGLGPELFGQVLDKRSVHGAINTITSTGLRFAVCTERSGTWQCWLDESTGEPKIEIRVEERKPRSTAGTLVVSDPEGNPRGTWAAASEGFFYTVEPVAATTNPTVDTGTSIEDDAAAYDLAGPVIGLARASLSPNYPLRDAFPKPVIVGQMTGALTEIIPISRQLHEVLEAVQHGIGHPDRHAEAPRAPLLGTHHWMYRSQHAAVACVVDGDLVSEYLALDAAVQLAVLKSQGRREHPAAVMEIIERLNESLPPSAALMAKLLRM